MAIWTTQGFPLSCLIFLRLLTQLCGVSILYIPLCDYLLLLCCSIIATPGRFMHVVVEMNLQLSSMEYAVFDEADR